MRMGRLLSSAAVAGVLCVATSPTMAYSLWTDYFSQTTGSGSIGQSAADGTGHAYVAGYWGTSAGTFKYNPDSSMAWNVWINAGDVRISDPYFLRNIQNFGDFVKVDSSGNVYMVGTTQNYFTPPGGGNISGYLVAKYNAFGTRQWYRTYYVSDTVNSSAQDMAIDSTGNVYVTGTTGNSGSYLTVKWDTAGNQLWARTYLGGIGRCIAVDGLNNVYVGGDAGVVKYDPSGTFQWANNLNGYKPVNSIQLDSNANAVIDFGGHYVGEVSPAGALLWSVYVTTALPGGAVVDAFNCVYTLGNVQGGVQIQKFNSAGTLLWTSTYSNSGTLQFGGSYKQLAVDTTGYVYFNVSLTPSGSGTKSMVTAAFDASTGYQRWVDINPGIATCAPVMVVPDNLGNVFSTGMSGGSFMIARYSN